MNRTIEEAEAIRHPVNAAMASAPLGERVADRVTGFIGSWRFLLIQSIIVLAWLAGNILLLVDFDPYPFILLNLAFSTQAAYAAPLILLASNRAVVRDRMTLEHAAAEADLEEMQNEILLRGHHEVVDRLEALEKAIAAIDAEVRRRGSTPADA